MSTERKPEDYTLSEDVVLACLCGSALWVLLGVIALWVWSVLHG